jgi:hypothetical protein
MTIQLKPILPKKFPIGAPKGIKTRLERALRKEAKEDKRWLKKTTRTWKGKKPRFKADIEITSNSMVMDIVPFGNEKAVNKWKWLNEGTKIRWAVMVGNFTSRRGRGGPVIIGKKAMRKRNIAARPGIKARKWTQLVRKIREPIFLRQMRKEFGDIAEGKD